jgi:hypothetical protein
MTNKFGVHSGNVVAKRYTNDKVTELTASDSISIDASKGELFTLTPTEAADILVSNGKNGQNISLVILTSGASSFTLTFDTGFVATGTLATGTVTAKTFVVTFKNVNGTFYEISRTTAM